MQTHCLGVGPRVDETGAIPKAVLQAQAHDASLVGARLHVARQNKATAPPLLVSVTSALISTGRSYKSG